MTEPAQYDVAIAGGGLVGLTLGIALEQAGLHVLVVDQEPASKTLDGSFDGRASAIALGPWRMLERLGVASHLGEAQQILGMMVTDRFNTGASNALGLHFDAAEAGSGIGASGAMGLMVENRRLRAALDTVALQAKALDLVLGASVTRHDVESGCVRVSLSTGQTVSAQVLVGADGKRSRVRQHAGIRTSGWSYRQTAIVTTVEFQHDHEGIAHEVFVPDGPLAILPLTNRRGNIVWSQPAASARSLMELDDTAFDDALSERLGDFLGTTARIGPRFAYPLSVDMAQEWVKPRIALAGDSAHTIHPVAGQGLNLGLKDVAALVHVLAEAYTLGQDLGDLAVLERYARWRRFDVVSMAVATDVFVRTFSTQFEPLRLLGKAGLAIADRFQFARRFFMAEAGGTTGQLPDLLRERAH